MQSISNDVLQVTISAKGAELQNIQHFKNGLEYLWNGDANFWGKKSPVLFPIVGGLKNGEYTYSGKTYKLGRHGFAREMEFEVTNLTNQSVEYTLTSNEQTLAVYPFEFNLKIIYSLKENTLTCEYIVTNTSNDTTYFSCGAHPAFAVPLTKNTTFEDWFLEFSSIENVGKWPL